jgi:hypothetical protein
MPKTISTHNGGQNQANRAHNNREDYVTKTQEHIDPNLSKYNEYILDVPPRVAYEQIFGAALREYNEKQSRPERRIDDYYNHVRKDKKKNAVYEMIIQVGDKDDTGVDFSSTQTERAIIKEFINDWKRRNPSLKLIGAYIHADEPGGTLHAHLNYIPVATGYKRGLAVQNGLNKALAAQGFVEKKGKETPQIQWERRENAILEAICNTHGVEVHHPKSGKPHLDTIDYKRKKMQAELTALEAAHKKLNAEHAQRHEERAELERQCSTLIKERNAAEGEILRYSDLQVEISKVDLEEKKIPLTNKVAVNSEELDKIKEQAKAYRVNRKEIKQIRQDKEDVAETKSYLAAEIRKANQLMEKAQRQYQLQLNLNAAYESEKRKREAAEATLFDEKKKNSDLKATLAAKDKLIDTLRAALRTAYTAIMNIARAVGMLKYDSKDGYKVESLSPQQERLIDAVANHSINLTKKAGYDDFAEKIDATVAISNDISQEIDALKPHVRSRGLSR